MPIPPFQKYALSGAVVLSLAACAAPRGLQAFSTDGCSMFPDRSPIGKADWCGCCVAHDLAYWRGGSADERLGADRELRRCVQAAAGSAALADAMLAGVRVGGVPYLATSYRWAYGWPYGRFYTPLSSAEDAQVAALRASYMAENPVLACTSGQALHPRAANEP